MVRHLTLDDQIRLFAESVSRLNISPEFPGEIQNIKVNVVRNEALEPTLKLVDRFLLNFGIVAQWNIGPYDDTFQILDFMDTGADATMLWADWRRINPKNIDQYSDQLGNISIATNGKPLIILSDLPGDVDHEMSIKRKIQNTGSVFVEDFSDVIEVESWRDIRLKLRNGTDLSNKGSMAIARRLGQQRIPELFLPILKCIVVDLDNTLYGGTLGEDGIQNLTIQNEHIEIARQLKRLKSKGVFLAIASKNQDSDFLELLEARADFPFVESDFSVRRICWGTKSQSIREIATELHIGLDSIAFIDDNPAEFQEVSESLAEVQTIFAQNPAMLLRQVSLGPRFSDALIDTTGGKRELDAKSNKIREGLSANTKDPNALHQELGTQIRISFGHDVDVERVSDMFARTNQFNLSLRRSEQIEIRKKLESASGYVLTASVTDRFADSGVVAAMIGDVETDGYVHINEFVISCRALGRGLETPLADLMISELQRRTQKEIEFLNFDREIGPRNEPALRWIQQLLDNRDVDITSGFATVSRNFLKQLNSLSHLLIMDSE